MKRGFDLNAKLQDIFYQIEISMYKVKQDIHVIQYASEANDTINDWLYVTYIIDHQNTLLLFNYFKVMSCT